MSNVNEDEEGKIVEKDVDDLIRTFGINQGHYVFLIGAGTSKPASIPTAGGLISKWRKTKYLGQNEVEEIEDQDEFQNWYSNKEDEEMEENQSEYGFWFKQCLPEPRARRRYIQDLVEGKEPTFGLVALASLMSKKSIPITLTPNFDSLLYDSFYYYLEEKPLRINHDSIASEFRLTRDRPTIIKLHGDFLYSNLKNTAKETSSLENNMSKALKQSLDEHGLIVIGYGGNDDSIMGVLEDIEDIPNGLWWCVLEDQNQEDLSEKTKSLLQEPERFLVKIEGSEQLFTSLWNKVLGPNPNKPSASEIEKNAEKRANKLRSKMGERKDKSSGEEKKTLENMINKDSAIEGGNEALERDDFREAIEAFSKAIELDPEYSVAYNNRGHAYNELGEYERAIEDFDEAIELDPEDSVAYNNRGYAYNKLGEYERAIEDLDKSIELDPEYEKAYINRGHAYKELGEYERAIEDFDKAIKLDPENAYAYGNRSELWLIKGEPKEALKDAKKSYEVVEERAGRATSLMLKIIAKTLLGKEVGDDEEVYREICSQDFEASWRFEKLDSWLETADVEKEDYIKEIINLLREHQE